MGRSPVNNGSWRLFAPQHGLRGEAADYARISPTVRHPVIYVDWFSAWCFCRWARWNNISCNLPWENQWEYAAKFGTPWDWRYWWGDEWAESGQKITADGSWKTDSTTEPNPEHANPHMRKLDYGKGLGLMDMLGNVQEWCLDQYRPAYEQHAEDESGDASSSRCLRGCSFNDLPEYCRSAFRFRFNPSISDFNFGVRVSRAAGD